MFTVAACQSRVHDATAPLALDLLEIAGIQPFDLLELALVQTFHPLWSAVLVLLASWASHATPGDVDKLYKQGRGLGRESTPEPKSPSAGSARIVKDLVAPESMMAFASPRLALSHGHAALSPDYDV